MGINNKIYKTVKAFTFSSQLFELKLQLKFFCERFILTHSFINSLAHSNSHPSTQLVWKFKMWLLICVKDPKVSPSCWHKPSAGPCIKPVLWHCNPPSHLIVICLFDHHLFHLCLVLPWRCQCCSGLLAPCWSGHCWLGLTVKTVPTSNQIRHNINN